MQRTAVETRTVVYEIVCDRCGKEDQRDGNDFELMTSIGFQAGYASIFGDGNRVEIDLCEPCLRDTLGTWLRVTTPVDTPLARMLAKFKPGVHGGAFPIAADSTLACPDDLPVQERMPIDADPSPGVEERMGALAEHMESGPSETPHRERMVATLSIGSFDKRPIEAYVHWRLQFDWTGDSGNELQGYFLDEQKNESFRLQLDGAAAHPLTSDEHVDLLPFVVAEFCKAMFGSTMPPGPEPRHMSWSHAELAIVEFGHPRLVPVHGPVHASWLNQIEIYFSIVQRKVLTPNDFPCLEAVAERLANFERYFESIARPFEWKFTRADLNALVARLRNRWSQDQHLKLAA